MFRFFFLVIATGISICAFSQNIENSPYSAIGIGNIGFVGDAFSNGTAGAITAETDSTVVNLYNPSSYALIAKQLPLFSFGINHYQKSFALNDQISKGRYAGISHFALVVPFANRFGLAAGLKPLSRMGYEVDDGTPIYADSVFYNYKGSGNIQEFILGFSAIAFKLRHHQLSLGVNGKYYFGSVEYQRKAYQISKGIEAGGMEIKSLHANDWGVEFGLNYGFQPNPTHQFNFGAVYRPENSTRFEKRITRYYFGNIYNQATYDTLLNTGKMNGKIVIPIQTNFGLTYTLTPQNTEEKRRTNLMTLKISLEYSDEKWEDYREDFNGITAANQYVQTTAYRLGISLTPHRVVTDRLPGFNYLNKINYRAGAYFVQTPYQVKNEAIIDKGFSIGVGVPIIVNRVVSTINVSAIYGKMGAENNPAILTEKYWGINLGINIAPGYDRWFRKYKLD